MSSGKYNSAITAAPRDGNQELREQDRLWICIAIVVVVAGFCLTVVEGNRVSLSAHPALQLPAMCGSQAWLGIDCPLCGMTRSVIYFVHGQWLNSWETHRLGWLVLFAIVGQIPYRLLVPRQRRLANPRWRRSEALFWASLGVLLIVNRLWDILV